MTKNLDPNEIRFCPFSSGIDSFGRVFQWDNRLFRAVNHESIKHCMEMFSSGMIGELVTHEFIPETWITDLKLDGYGLIVEHRRISPMNFPEEWSFSMLRDAAVIVLKMNAAAMKYGFQTKDCHGGNIMFDGCEPKYVDLGSFVKVSSDLSGLLSIDEFIRYYLYVLEIWSEGNDYIARRMLTGCMPHYSYHLYRHGVDSKKGSKLKQNVRTLARISYEMMPPAVKKTVKRLIRKYRSSRTFDNGLDSSAPIDVLLKQVEGFSLGDRDTPWTKYHDEDYTETWEVRSSSRFDRIIEIVKKYDIKSITDLGANQGLFSRLSIKRAGVEKAVCIDRDENAVDKMYDNTKKVQGERGRLLPVLLDVMSDLSFLGYENCFPYSEGRFKSDAVFALALTHHLLLSQQLSIDYIFWVLTKYTRRYAFIEFMPLGLWAEGKETPPIPAWYSVDWFKENFKKYFRLILEEKIEKNRILFFGEL